MIRSFWTVTVLLSALLFGMTAHYLLADRAGLQRRIDQTVAVTGLASPAYHAAWYEPRLRRFEARINPAYPELLSADRQSFIYGDLYAQ